MDRNTEITLDQVYNGIVAALSAQFPGTHVEAEREGREKLPVPAILVDLNELEPAPDHDPGTDQLAVTATFSAQIVMGFRQEAGKSAKKEVKKLAAAVAAFARLKRWGCPIGPAEGVGAYPDDFDPALDQYECWRVDWQQVLHLGETVWDNDGIRPTVLVIGRTPMVGPDFEADYARLGEAPPTDVANETTLVLA